MASSSLKEMRLFWLLKLQIIETKEIRNVLLPDIEKIHGQKLFAVLAGMRQHLYADIDMLEAMLRGAHMDFKFNEVFIE